MAKKANYGVFVRFLPIDLFSHQVATDEPALATVFARCWMGDDGKPHFEAKAEGDDESNRWAPVADDQLCCLWARIFFPSWGEVRRFTPTLSQVTTTRTFEVVWQHFQVNPGSGMLDEPTQIKPVDIPLARVLFIYDNGDNEPPSILVEQPSQGGWITWEHDPYPRKELWPADEANTKQVLRELNLGESFIAGQKLRALHDWLES